MKAKARETQFVVSTAMQEFLQGSMLIRQETSDVFLELLLV